ncbi:hypothetical protein ACTIVE_1635 [Actinomadura verrucosospora]|uniref:Uncharacterized protein n=1 Tax=Actinomadura verrucosospora TaxID=46165 RepID=A0A7D3VQW3_ACTVE|nr:hypothetical protein ACTIVE_1635 [Actinomadura verrucosospora]
MPENVEFPAGSLLDDSLADDPLAPEPAILMATPRVSTGGLRLDRQLAALKQAGYARAQYPGALNATPEPSGR